ncbi:MAG: bifunctional DNA primase/polymerase [Patescibacteria group bacterium]
MEKIENHNEYIMALAVSSISIIPITEGEKKPHSILGKTHDLLIRRATLEEIEKWIAAGVTSWATAGGPVSENLVIIDFDEKHYYGLYDLWYAKLSDEQREIVGTFHKSSTRNGGTHLRCRTKSPHPTIKLAKRWEWNEKTKKEDPVTTAEIRGEGSYALIPPSAGYTTTQGSLLDLPVISDEIYEELIDILRVFNEVEDEPATEYEWKPRDTPSGDRPGDWLNEKATWNEILDPHGWVEEDKNHWRRPGKDKGEGISATTDYDGIPMFYVFSTSAAPFEEKRGYSKFHVFTLLNYNGNFKAAAKVAAEKYPQEEKKELPKRERIHQFEKPEVETDFEDWKEVIVDNFPDLVFPSEVAASVLSQILIKDITNPSAIVFVDVPSSGKTIGINFFSDIPELAYPTDKFTPASFVSNAANVKKSKLAEIDLLPRVQYKMLIIRDLATLFSKREDDLTECLGILTRLLDGEGLNTDSGIHGQRQYNGEYLFMILAASTPIPPKVWKIMGNLGSRLFFLKMHSRDKLSDELIGQLRSSAYKEKEKICRLATKNFMQSLWYRHKDGIVWDKNKDKEEDLLVIARCAQILAKLRGVVNVWDDGFDYSYTTPVIEKPDRINQLFYNLARGHAFACGRTQIDRSDLKIPVELSMDSVITSRANLLSKIVERGGTMSTTDIEKELTCSKTTALKEMEIFTILGVCSMSRSTEGLIGGQEKEITLSEEFKWLLSEECRSIRGLPPVEIKTDEINQ